MPTILWNEAYSMFDAELDGHHQQLIRYIQILDDRDLRAKADEEFVTMVVQGLVDYTGYHFGAEEARMRDLGSPGLGAHQREHADFVKDVSIFREQFGKGSPRLERVLLNYLKDWLLTHILASDKRFGTWAKEGHPGVVHTGGGDQ